MAHERNNLDLGPSPVLPSGAGPASSRQADGAPQLGDEQQTQTSVAGSGGALSPNLASEWTEAVAIPTPSAFPSETFPSPAFPSEAFPADAFPAEGAPRGAIPTDVPSRRRTSAPAHPDANPADLLVYRTLPATQGDLYRLSRLLWVLLLLAGVFIAPSLAARFQYSMTAAQERARLEVAREHLGDFQLEQLRTAFRLLAQSVSPSVVSIRTSSDRGMGQGSGVIVDKDGYILTNNHVVEGVDTAEVLLSDGRTGPASVVGVDPLIDIALIKTELGDLTPAQWGDADDLEVGDPVWAVGSPFGLQKSITAGILSAKERRGIITGKRFQEFLQTDAPVNPGNSGGPLVNIEGKVVGINTAIIGPLYQGISFAIPSALAHDAYVQLREHGYVLRGFLGVTPEEVPENHARSLGIERGRGVLVAAVPKNTPAYEAGLEPGDVIMSWNRQEFSDPILLSQSIAATPIGERASLHIVRPTSFGPKELDLEVTVAARPRSIPVEP